MPHARYHDGSQPLGRFGHHPDPAIDFCVEVDFLRGMQYDVGCRRASEAEFNDRVTRALEFRVGGDQHAIAAKDVLREMASCKKGPAMTPEQTAEMARIRIDLVASKLRHLPRDRGDLRSLFLDAQRELQKASSDLLEATRDL